MDLKPITPLQDKTSYFQNIAQAQQSLRLGSDCTVAIFVSRNRQDVVVGGCWMPLPDFCLSCDDEQISWSETMSFIERLGSNSNFLRTSKVEKPTKNTCQRHTNASFSKAVAKLVPSPARWWCRCQNGIMRRANQLVVTVNVRVLSHH